ncbi:MAG: hypothetical protein KC464_27835, partial [Myxococcales bacterium]|nr:hypothetical protein [Myxococcales bacterium]
MQRRRGPMSIPCGGARTIAGAIAIVAAALTAACAPVATPRFPDDVAAAVVADDMRRLETATLVLYYPAGRDAEVARVAATLERCVAASRGRTQLTSWTTGEKPVVVMPAAPFNNAYVAPRTAGDEDVAVVPTYDTLDFTSEFGLPPDPGMIGCHEMIHYVQAQQVGGVWAALDRVLGDLVTPQAGLDAWFWEGLAVHYETALNPGAGRLAWPVWRGVFAAGYADGGLDGDDLSEWKRLAPPGHHYLVGSHFVDWLIATYGEARLWQVIAAQGSSVAFTLGVSGRFKDAYGKGLGDLVAEFRRALTRTLERRESPTTQRRVRAVGSDARYARAATGAEAVIVEDLDAEARLQIRDARGEIVVDRALVEVVPPRGLATAAALLVSGMAFTGDGARLFFTVVDQGATYQTTRLVAVDVATGALDVVASGLGPGGAIAPDGATYYAMDVDGDAWGLAAVTLATGARRVVVPATPGRYVLRAAPSPSGDRLALSVWDGRFAIWIVDAATGARLATIDGATAVYDPSFVDDDRLIYLRDVDRRFQVVVRDGVVGDAAPERVISDAPYTAFEPRAAAGTVRFLDREAWRWDLAEIA